MRPTMDVVKGAIFSSLADAVPGACVLDLFAGSGALGIEALSRGASRVLFVESDPRACDCIAENLRKTRLAGSVKKSDVFDFLKQPPAPARADIVLADPPYSKSPGAPDFAAQLVCSPHLPQHVAPGASFVLEVSAGWRFPESSPWECAKRRRYGATEVLFLHLRDSTPPETGAAGCPVPSAPSPGTL
jgi:16S rRNA (guanine966-N2)-methyltransferase